VKPDGSAVVAGSAPPGATISVFEDTLLLGKTTADANGEWVVVLEKRLGPGQHLISVAAELEDATTLLAETSIAIEIYADQTSKPLVALLPENQTEMPSCCNRLMISSRMRAMTRKRLSSGNCANWPAQSCLAGRGSDYHCRVFAWRRAGLCECQWHLFW
jgi:hypothetical protein